MDGRLIAHFYIFHDTFFTDLIAAAPSIAEVGPLACLSRMGSALLPFHEPSLVCGRCYLRWSVCLPACLLCKDIGGLSLPMGLHCYVEAACSHEF